MTPLLREESVWHIDCHLLVTFYWVSDTLKGWWLMVKILAILQLTRTVHIISFLYDKFVFNGEHCLRLTVKICQFLHLTGVSQGSKFCRSLQLYWPWQWVSERSKLKQRKWWNWNCVIFSRFAGECTIIVNFWNVKIIERIQNWEVAHPANDPKTSKL